MIQVISITFYMHALSIFFLNLASEMMAFSKIKVS